MLNKILYLYILSAIFSTAGVFVFADEPSVVPNHKSSVDTSDVSMARIPPVPQDVVKAYEKAVDLYRQKDYYSAQTAFDHINKIAPNYRATSSYLKIIEEDIIIANHRFSQTQSREIKGQQEGTESVFNNEKVTLLPETEEKRHREMLDKQAQEVYTEALELYRNREFSEAKKKFEAISLMIPDYKDTKEYLVRIDRNFQEKQEKALENQRLAEQADLLKKQEVERQQEQEAKELQHKIDIQDQAQSLYVDAVALLDKKNMDEALIKFNEIEQLSPDFKSTRMYISRIEQWKIDQQNQLLEAQKEAEAQTKELTREEKPKGHTKDHTIEIEEQQSIVDNYIRVKEIKYKTQLDQLAQQIYDRAIILFQEKKYQLAKKTFEQVESIDHNYLATNNYLKIIDQDIITADTLAAQEIERQKREIERQKKEAEAARVREEEKEHKAQIDQQVQKVYDQAVVLYESQKFIEAKKKFEEAQALLPNYKSINEYLGLINHEFLKEQQNSLWEQKKEEAQERQEQENERQQKHDLQEHMQPSPVQIPMPEQVKTPVSLEDQQKQAQEISALAEKSAQLYRRVADMTNDESTEQTKRKMAEVNNILNNLKENDERRLHQIREEQLRFQQEEESKAQAESRAKARKLYQEGREYLRSRDYAKAKIKFMELEDTNPNYKSTRRYLNQIEDDLKRSGVEEIAVHEEKESENFKQLQKQENVEAISRIRKEQEDQRYLEQQQQASFKELTQKASSINDDIIRLSQEQDYEAMKAKFVELENTVTALTTLKDQMAQQKVQDRESQLARTITRRRINSEKQEVGQIQARDNAQPLKENRPELSNQPNDVDIYKRREIMQEQNMLFSEGVDRYRHKKYTQAKLLFDELAARHDRRAEAWLRKVNHAITQELLRSQEAEERERTAFLADQLKAQRDLLIIQERERQRQKKLTEELERQKRLYEDDRLLQMRKEETMKAQERERQRQEEKRLESEKESEKQQEIYRFHKVRFVPQPVRPATSRVETMAGEEHQQSQGVPKVPPAVVRPALVQPAVVQPTVLQPVVVRPAVVQPAIVQSVVVPRAIVRPTPPPLLDLVQRFFQGGQVKTQPQELNQEEKHKDEVLSQQDQEREEKNNQEKILREETQRRQELEHQEHQSQTQLEAEREIVHKQLEDGVEAMYQEALSLYKQGDYALAAGRFKDVLDILPGYKRAGQYMDEARLKSSVVKPQAAFGAEGSTNMSSMSLPVGASASVSRQQSISKALDLFDPDAK